MSKVEQNLTSKNIELMDANPEFQKRKEDEAKLIPTNPEALERFKAGAVELEQIYLNQPWDEASLRVRVEYHADRPVYSVALKNKGKTVEGKLSRLQIERDINPQAFAYYQGRSDTFPLSKRRAEPVPKLTVDFIDALPTPLVEDERQEAVPSVAELFGTDFINVSDDIAYHNENIAFNAYPERQAKHPETLDELCERVVNDMISRYSLGYPVVVGGISGMAGSGKSTAVRHIADSIAERFGESFRPVILSTDNYHRGRRFLENMAGRPWTNWDSPVVYDTVAMAQDLERLRRGEEVIDRRFDFQSEETVETGVLRPSPLILIEGLYASSKDLDYVRDLHYEMPTGLATSVYRDVRRLLIEGRSNDSLGTPEDRLAYLVEVAIPTYQEHRRNLHNSFSANCRPMAERAFLLSQLAATAPQLES